MLEILLGMFAGINVPNGIGCSYYNFLNDKLRLRRPNINFGSPHLI